MKRKGSLTTVLAVTLTICLTAGFASGAWEIEEVVSAVVDVQKVDLEKREVTVKEPQGNVMTLRVDKRVKRLNEVKPGDKVEVDYYVSLASEIREPTAAEKESPITVLEAAGKAPPETAPAGVGLIQIKAVVTIVAINRAAEMVTLKGPLGNYLAVRVVDPSRLEKVDLGDTVVVTYTEALAISVEKVK
jgi:Cu/Ag efflux protein CusF